MKKLATVAVLVAMMCLGSSARAELPRRAKIGVAVFTLLGLGALATTVGLVGVANNEIADLKRENLGQYKPEAIGPHFQGSLDYELQFKVAMGLAGASAVMFAAAILWAAFDQGGGGMAYHHQPKPPRLALLPAVSPQGGGLSLAVRF